MNNIAHFTQLIQPRVYELCTFLTILYTQCQIFHNQHYLTLTAIHPIHRYPTPSRHIPLFDTDALQNALEKLLQANVMGWGAYFAVGLRRGNLGRYRRGGMADVVALPALYADIDTTDTATLHRLCAFEPPPSIKVHSGGGYHLYWLLHQPTTDLSRAGRMLKALAKHLDGDTLSIANSMRLPFSLNTKPYRNNTLCTVIEQHDYRYTLSDFDHLLPLRTAIYQPYRTKRVRASHKQLNPDVIDAVTAELIGRYDGYSKHNGFVASLCPLGHHASDAAGKHFNFEPQRGYGHCFGRHGTANLLELCDALGIDVDDFGGIYAH
jgi:hypothetical protein